MKEVIYDDYYNNERFEEARKELFYYEAEEQGWDFVEEIPDKLVFEELHKDDVYMWEDFENGMKKILDRTPCLILGTTGRWNGEFSAGRFITVFSELRNGLQHLDNLRIVDKNGHLIIEGSHHDGNDRYEIKALTNKGRQIAEYNHFAHDKHLHEVLMKSNLFTGLPHLAKVIRGWLR